MPYIITTKQRVPTGKRLLHEPEHRKSRRAVATLDEAQSITWHALIDAHGAVGRQVPSDQAKMWREVREAGGVISSLPGGTVIEVAPRNWAELAGDVELPLGTMDGGGCARIIDAWNAKAEPKERDAYNAREA